METQRNTTASECASASHLGSPLLRDENVVAVQVAVLHPLLGKVSHAGGDVLDDPVADLGREAVSLFLVCEQRPQRPSLHKVRHDRQL